MKPKINARNAKIGSNVSFGKNVEISCDTFICGERCHFGDNTRITCRSFEAGDYLYFASGVEVGRGGCRGPQSTVKIGDYVGVFENTVINPSEPVEIGDYVGIGADVMIWTHGAWLDPLEGFPAGFGPVSIGSNVWLPARSIVLPNTSVGDNTVITINSVINRDVPSNCLAGGNPVKVIRSDMYPKTLTFEKKTQTISAICDEWLDLIAYKAADPKPAQYSFEVIEGDGLILYVNKVRAATFGILEKPYTLTVHLENIREIAEDLRDFLRRNGIKVFTGDAFRSIAPPHERLTEC